MEEGDDQLIGDLLTLMAKVRADYTLTFRGLTEPDEHWLALFDPVPDEALEWLTRYRARRDGDPAAMNRGQSQICPAQLGGRNRDPRGGGP